MKTLITKNFKETQKLAQGLAGKMGKGAIIALEGDLGSGKTTFTQGLLKELKIKGPYTSPTFVIIKQYKPTTNNQQLTIKNKKKSSVVSGGLSVYHLDAYRVSAKDVLNLGWKELVAEKNNIIIIEWADRIKKIIPKRAKWIKFKWLDNQRRKIEFK